MTTEADRKRFAFLDHLVTVQGKEPSMEEVLWLLGRLRAALYRPDEFAFPEYACLVVTSPDDRRAFALRRLLKPGWSRETAVPPGAPKSAVEVFSATAECVNHNAFLVARPWIRARAGTSPDGLERLRGCTVTLLFDNEPLLSRAPADDYLIGPDGEGLRRMPPVLQPGSDLFYRAVEITEQQEADGRTLLGVFAPRSTEMSLRLEFPDCGDGPGTRVVAGLAAMEYTTVGNGSDGTPIPRGSTSMGTPR